MTVLSLDPHAAQVVYRMFVNTADQNYVMARTAFFRGFGVDFYWLSVHALEKYFKAILLLNGQTSIGFKHDIIGLHKTIQQSFPEIAFGPFKDPNLDQMHWSNRTVEEFLSRIYGFGNAHNRYLTYGHATRLDDLLKIDQLIWSVRRHCQPLIGCIRIDGTSKTVDMVDQLQRSPSLWKIYTGSIVETACDGGGNEDIRHSLLHLNFAFDPDADRTLAGDRSAWESSPISDLIKEAQSAQTVPEYGPNPMKALEWVLENIFFNKDDSNEITKVLASRG